MLNVGVISKNADNIITMLNRLFNGTPTSIEQSPSACDILVADGGISTDAALPSCAALVVNSDDQETEAAALELAENNQSPVPVGLIITYGFNKKACVTASSVADDSCAICVQRSFATLSGARCFQSEFTVQRPENDNMPVSAVLAAVAAALVGDVLFQ